MAKPRSQEEQKKGRGVSNLLRGDGKKKIASSPSNRKARPSLLIGTGKVKVIPEEGKKGGPPRTTWKEATGRRGSGQKTRITEKGSFPRSSPRDSSEGGGGRVGFSDQKKSFSPLLGGEKIPLQRIKKGTGAVRFPESKVKKKGKSGFCLSEAQHPPEPHLSIIWKRMVQSL